MAKRITLLDLVKAGLLEDGEKLECHLRSGRAFCEVKQTRTYGENLQTVFGESSLTSIALHFPFP